MKNFRKYSNRAVWLSVSAICAITATVYAADTTISLQKGMNLVSSPVNGKMIDSSYLKTQGVLTVLAYDTQNQNYRPYISYIRPGMGYFLESTSVLSIPVSSAYMLPTISLDQAGILSQAAVGKWNLLGVPFDTTTESIKALSGSDLTDVWRFDQAAQSYVSTGALKAGDGFWFMSPNAVTVPSASFTDPLNRATGVSINRNIAISFTEPMNPDTINTGTFTLTGPSGAVVPSAVTYSGLTATFNPTAALAPNTLYTATVNKGAKSLLGNALIDNYVWSFTTGTVADATAPAVSSTIALSNATGVPVNQSVAAIFSKTLDPTSVNATTFKLSGPGAAPVAGAVTYVGSTVTFTPTTALAANTVYTATLTKGIKDLAIPANPMAADYVWSFTTGAAPDVTAPTVSNVIPPNGAIGVGLNQIITAVFSKTMNPLTLNTTTVTVTGPNETPI